MDLNMVLSWHTKVVMNEAELRLGVSNRINFGGLAGISEFRVCLGIGQTALELV